MKYTGPSMPTFNLYCDEDLDIVLSVLGEKLEQVYRERGLDLSPLTFPSCFDLTNIQKTNLVSVLNGILSKICEIEDKGVIVKTSIDNVRVFLDKLPDTFWSTCITAPNPCDNEITLTDLLQHIISEICDLFDSLGLGNPTRLQNLISDPTYNNILTAASNYAANLATLNGHTSSISTLQTKTADVNLVTDALSTSLNLTTAVTSLDASLLTTLQLVTGGTAVSNPTYGFTLNATGVNKGAATYPTNPTSVKQILNNLIYDVLNSSSSVTGVTYTRTAPGQATVALTQTGGTSPINSTIDINRYVVRLATNYPTSSLPTWPTGSATNSSSPSVTGKYGYVSFDSSNTVTNAASSWYTAGNSNFDGVKIQANGIYRITIDTIITIDNPGRSITNIELTSNVATITTASAHGYQVGQVIVVAGINAQPVFNGSFVITAVGATTISYARTNGNIGSVANTEGYVTLAPLEIMPQLLKTTTSSGNWTAGSFSVGRLSTLLTPGSGYASTSLIPHSSSFNKVMSLSSGDIVGVGLAFSQTQGTTTNPTRYYYSPSLTSGEFVVNLTVEQLT
jgi:hypothetical protein